MESAQRRLQSISGHLHRSKPLIIILLGAPGSGKGTFAKLISKHYKIPAISTGELVRNQIKADTPLGQELKAIAASGGYVSDDKITGLLKERIAMDDCADGFILDGYPRTMNQAMELIKLVPHITLVLEIYLPFEVILKTTNGRRVCSNCGNGYNVTSINQNGIVMLPLLPKGNPDECDDCKIKLTIRADDGEQVVRERLLIYDSQTRPLLAHYTRQGLLITHKIARGKSDWPQVQERLDQYITSTTTPPSSPTSNDATTTTTTPK